MTTWNLVKKDRSYYVEGLKDEWCESNDTMLIVRYDSGDCDTIQSIGENMHHALYDLYQTSDTLKDGDEFSIDGTVVYRCQGIHVVEA